MVEFFEKGKAAKMANRTLIGFAIGLVYAAAILLGYYFDRAVTSYFLCVVVAISIMEVRYALGDRISTKIGILIWIFAMSYGIFYFAFGFTGVVFFTLAVFIVGCIIIIFSIKEDIASSIFNFAFLLVYPALIMSALFYINKARDTTTGELTPYNTVCLCLAFLISCFTDMFAYFFGVMFGKRKLVSHISPKKTVSGAVGGLFGGLVGAFIVYLLFETPFALFGGGLAIVSWLKVIVYILMGLFGSIFTQAGDLIASVVKRYCEIKDYSSLLGSHGGVMDRFDGVMFNSVFVALVLAFIL